MLAVSRTAESMLDSQSVQLNPFSWVKNFQTEMFPTLEEDETIK